MCVAIPAQVVEVTSDGHFATVEASAVRRKINVDLLAAEGGASAGDWVLVHAGFAIAKVDANEAAEQIEFMRRVGSLSEARDELREYPLDDRS